jgi:hypothetical protein
MRLRRPFLLPPALCQSQWSSPSVHTFSGMEQGYGKGVELWVVIEQRRLVFRP